MSINKSTVLTLVILLLILLAGGITVYFAQLKQNQQKLAVSPAAKSFQIESGASGGYTDIAGNEVNLEQYVGKVLIVHSWASWSPFSQNELRLLSEIALQHVGQEVQIVAINRGEDVQVAQQYLISIGVAEEIVLVVDPDDQYYKNIGGYTMPETILYSKEGEIVQHIRGQLQLDALLASVQAQLNTQ